MVLAALKITNAKFQTNQSQVWNLFIEWRSLVVSGGGYFPENVRTAKLRCGCPGILHSGSAPESVVLRHVDR